MAKRFTTALTLDVKLGLTEGGTGQATANAALNALLPAQTGNANKLLSTDGTNSSWATSTSADLSNVVAAGVTSTILAATCRHIVSQYEIVNTGILSIADGGYLEIG